MNPDNNLIVLFHAVPDAASLRRCKGLETKLTLYLLFIAMAALTILSPGPGVLKSVTNSLNYGWRPALSGVVGLSCGVLCVASLCATGLGMVISASTAAFETLRIAGTIYLVYLGFRLWHAKPSGLELQPAAARLHRHLYIEGVLLQFSNPNAVIFFVSVLPQFIDHSAPYLPQFSLLVLSFCLLMLLIHGGYVFFAQKARRWLNQSSGRLLNRSGAVVFWGLGFYLLVGAR